MARGGKGESGQQAPGPCSLRPGERSGERQTLGEAPTVLPVLLQRPRAGRASRSRSRLVAGEGQ